MPATILGVKSCKKLGNEFWAAVTGDGCTGNRKLNG
jgi:hypothetical protein